MKTETQTFGRFPFRTTPNNAPRKKQFREYIRFYNYRRPQKAQTFGYILVKATDLQ
jgi:hypothetical protein